MSWGQDNITYWCLIDDPDSLEIKHSESVTGHLDTGELRPIEHELGTQSLPWFPLHVAWMGAFGITTMAPKPPPVSCLLLQVPHSADKQKLSQIRAGKTRNKTGTSQVGAISKAQIKSKGGDKNPFETKKFQEKVAECRKKTERGTL